MKQSHFLKGIHRRCFAHVLNLGILNGIKNCERSLKGASINRILKKCSPKLLERMEERANNINAEYLNVTKTYMRD